MVLPSLITLSSMNLFSFPLNLYQYMIVMANDLRVLKIIFFNVFQTQPSLAV